MAKDLGAPNVPQWGTGADLRRTDCGVACIDTALRFFNLGAFSVDQLTRETALMLADVGLTCEQVAELGLTHGLKAAVNLNTRISDIIGQIDQGFLVITLIAYRFIPNRLDIRDNVPGKDGHFIVVRGYTDDGFFICDDPDYWGAASAKGDGVHYRMSDVNAGIVNSEQPGRCIFVQGKNAPQVDHVAAINTHGYTGGINLRFGPSTASWSITTMPNAATITVLKGDPVRSGKYTWLPVQYGRYTGWVASDYVDDPQHLAPAMRTVPVGPAFVMPAGNKLHLRVAPGLDAQAETELASLTLVSILADDPVNADGHTWVRVNVGGVMSGWVAQEFLKAGIPPVTAPPPSKPINFVGWFLFPDDPGAFLAMCERLAKAGHPIPIVTVLNDAGLAEQIKAISPLTIVIFRVEEGNPGPGTPAQVWWDKLWPALSAAPHADFFEFANEGMEDGAAFVKFYNDLMDIAAQHTINGHPVHITVGDLAEGNSNEADIRQLLDRIATEGHVINYHEYSQPSDAGDASMLPDDQDLELRLFPWIEGHPGVFIAGGEAGTGRANYMGVARTVALWHEYNAIMLPHAARIKGGGSWWAASGRGYGWGRSTADEAFAAYEQMCMAM